MMSNLTTDLEIPASLNRKILAKILSGDIPQLEFAFTWAESPQGYQFWRSQLVAKKLTEEGRAILELWLNTEP
jgi:hypothetical protein